MLVLVLVCGGCCSRKKAVYRNRLLCGSEGGMTATSSICSAIRTGKA